MLKSYLSAKHFMFSEIEYDAICVNDIGGMAAVMEKIRHKFSPWGRPVSWLDFKGFSFAKPSKASLQVGSYIVTLETVEVENGTVQTS